MPHLRNEMSLLLRATRMPTKLTTVSRWHGVKLISVALRNAVLQGFNLKNRKTCSITGRVIEQVHSRNRQAIRQNICVAMHSAICAAIYGAICVHLWFLVMQAVMKADGGSLLYRRAQFGDTQGHNGTVGAFGLKVDDL